MSSVKRKIERKPKRTHIILSALSTKTIKKRRERWLKQRTSKYHLLFHAAFSLLTELHYSINFHSLRKLQAFCPLGDAIRPKAKQTEIRAAGFIHHPRCSLIPGANNLEYDWISNRQKKCFSFLFFFWIWGHTNTRENLKIVESMN